MSQMCFSIIKSSHTVYPIVCELTTALSLWANSSQRYADSLASIIWRQQCIIPEPLRRLSCKTLLLDSSITSPNISVTVMSTSCRLHMATTISPVDRRMCPHLCYCCHDILQGPKHSTSRRHADQTYPVMYLPAYCETIRWQDWRSWEKKSTTN